MDSGSASAIAPLESDRSVVIDFLRCHEPLAMYLLQALSETIDLGGMADNWALVWEDGKRAEGHNAESPPERRIVACGFRLEATTDLHFQHICCDESDVAVQACFRRLYTPPLKGVCGSSPLLRNALTDPIIGATTEGRRVVFEQLEDAFILDPIENEGLATLLNKAEGFMVSLAEACDLDELVPLEQAYQKEENSQDLDAEQALGSVKEFQEKGRLFVGRCSDGIVAMVRFHVALDDAILVNDVFVSSRCRGKGLGKAIVAGALQKWKEKHDCFGSSTATHSNKAILHVGQTNIVARRTYESLGFRQPPRKEAMHCLILG